MKKDKLTALANKKVNHKYYTKMTSSLNEDIFLTEKEFNEGKQGYIYFDYENRLTRLKDKTIKWDDEEV